MGFTPTFYASRPKLSEVTIDSDLNMGGRNILRVGRIDSPYSPETWPTEELDWGDTAENVQTLVGYHDTLEKVVLFSANSGPKKTKWILRIRTAQKPSNYGHAVIQILADDVEILKTDALDWAWHEFVFYPPPEASIVVYHSSNSSVEESRVADGFLKDTGMVVGPKTFDLSGKWLALGLDMKGLAATVKIHGVDIPYSDYAKYFPIAPTELSIPGDWSPSQERPVIKVYK